MRTQGESAPKLKPAREKDDQKKEGHRRMTEERETKTENIFIELQEEDTKPVLKDEEPLPPKLTE